LTNYDSMQGWIFASDEYPAFLLPITQIARRCNAIGLPDIEELGEADYLPCLEHNNINDVVSLKKVIKVYHGQKRTQSPEPLVPHESTFVFATSRLWTKRDTWVTTKKSTGEWKDIRGINADTLESWLETCPAVHR